MSTQVIEHAEITRPDDAELDLGPPFPRVSWGGIFAGVFLVAAWQIVLNLLGLGIGLSTLKSAVGGNAPGPAVTVATVIGWVVVTWFTFAAGGYVASRLAGSFREQDGVLHGLVVWAVVLVASAAAVTAALGAGGLALGSGVVATLGQMTAGAPSRPGSEMPGAAGQPAAILLRPQNPADLSDQAAAEEIDRGAAALAAGDRRVDRDRLAAVISAKTGLSPEEATKRLADWDSAAAAARAKARRAADQALDLGRKASLWGFIVLVLGAIAAAIGGGLGTLHARTIHIETRYTRYPPEVRD